jgi:hypothetical protein
MCDKVCSLRYISVFEMWYRYYITFENNYWTYALKNIELVPNTEYHYKQNCLHSVEFFATFNWETPCINVYNQFITLANV